MDERIKIFLLTVLPLFFLSTQILAQKNTQINILTQKLDVYVNNLAPEKVYIQTDKDFYIVGDTIWFKSYLLNGVTHYASDKSNIVYVELLDANGGTLVKRKLYTDHGSAFGDIQIDDSITEGDYRIRAYTRYMLNDEDLVIFEKKISILTRPMSINGKYNSVELVNSEKEKRQERNVMNSKMSKPNVQFFPEGGNLVIGLQSELGLKITDEFGNGLAMKGHIFDQKGYMIKSFQTYNSGLGVFPITPKSGTNYYAELNIDGILHRYSLPIALDKGYVIQLKNQGSQIIIKVSSNIDQGLTGTVILGHLRGEIFLKHSKKDSSKSSYLIKFPTSELSEGIAHFTLFNQQGEPICERLTFINNPENEIDITLTTDKSDYKFREKVDLKMFIADTQGKPLKGDFSISVALDKSFDKNDSNIKDWFLLNSDLGNTGENPNFFFSEDSDFRKKLLDILMLTHEWKRFAWKSFPLNESSRALEFLPEKGIMINGVTRAFDNRNQPIKALTTLSVLGQDIYQEKRLTDAQGRFSFGPLVFLDSVEAIINASSFIHGKNKNEKISIYLDTVIAKVNIDNLTAKESYKKTVSIQEELIKDYRDKVSGLEYSPRVTALSEVVVKAKKKTRKERIDEELNKMTVYGTAQNRLFPDSISRSTLRSVFDILTQVPGVQVLGTFPNQSVRIRGMNSFSSSGDPLFLKDGVPVSANFVQSTTLNDVLFVDILKGGEAAFYGSRGTNGVVAIYTDSGQSFESGLKEQPDVVNLVIPGFYNPREFYHPNYGVKKPNHKISDYRTTLYWNPEVIITEETTTKLNFYTGDVPGKFTLRLEGVTTDGKLVSKNCSFIILN
ncbi:TonB-dependent receptor plug domain-containing protein [Arenibacter sp. F26102]|uniref:TonB-dependent receptor plug domain-containing protein n=1 Tax=Arenibacter sp. F26102 TaxID=2926416 RepID=UPI001FF50E17|nr:TonB-dependent receptor plug domain-containing protein [Arenibacter sp. F26102]MCK0147618.1 TonB-dependent receptor plug domain-containing protein [Arenibacter sp. F26102]